MREKQSAGDLDSRVAGISIRMQEPESVTISRQGAVAGGRFSYLVRLGVPGIFWLSTFLASSVG